jgi:nitrogen fixation/metabolism regulation signal transduction histidine kinase
MVDEFSRFARLPEVRLEHENLNEIVEQVIALYEDRLEGAKLESEIGKDIPDTLIDPEQMKRVFVNLIDNAVEAFDDCVPDRKISLRTRFDPARGKLIAEVIDNGRGIAAADFGRLFQPYFSTKSRGTGLGLAIVHRIIVEHGGTIRASSNNGGGARFTIEIPVVS